MKFKNIFSKLSAFGVSALFFLSLKVNVSASNLGVPSIPNPTIFNSLEEIINFAAQLIRPIFVLTFIGMILYAAAVWLTSQGDDKKIEQARKIIVAAIVGLAVAVFAPAITGIVASFLGVDTLNIFSTP